MTNYGNVEVYRNNHLVIAKMPPLQFGAVAHVVKTKSLNSTRPMRASEVLAAHPEVLICLNGAQFLNGSDHPHGKNQVETYRMSQRNVMAFRLRDLAADIDIPGSRHDGSCFSVTPDGVVHTGRGDDFADGSIAGYQGYPTLVLNGKPCPTSYKHIVWMSACGVTTDHRVFLAVDVTSMDAFKRTLIAHGAQQVYYTDGGGSGRMASRDWVAGHPEDRPVASWLAVIAPGGGGGTRGVDTGPYNHVGS